MPDIAGEVGSGGDDLEDSEEDPIFDTQESQARARPQSVVQPGAPAIFQTGRTASEGGIPEPTKGMVVVRGQEGMAFLKLVAVQGLCKDVCSHILS